MAGFDPNSNLITGDYEYAAKNPGYLKQLHDILVHYGLGGLGTAGQIGGVDAATQQEIDANPYSVAKMLRLGHDQGQSTNANTANMHGALFSGANVNNMLHTDETYQQQLHAATEEAQGQLGGVQDTRMGTLWDIFNRLSQKPPVPDVTPSAPEAPAAPAPSYAPLGAPSGVGTATPTPQGPYQRTGPEAGGQVAKKVKPVSYAGRAL